MNRLQRLTEIAKKKTRTVVGLMSGTSVDAIDAVLVRITGTAIDGATMVKLGFESFPYPREIQSRINTLFDVEKAR
ncbi:MAG TPA: anhydro-N-acetylmuramic acid kinase, partial [Thermoanaerobaculia bacterium]